ncbi:MAG: carboxypeptidase regulatory-like domain-containing protein [Verrucomicrobia bacterium]|nr:carboxypeptidase regulatory-like domain-containing protein [Verrucomicrobiota bacterium]
MVTLRNRRWWVGLSLMLAASGVCAESGVVKGQVRLVYQEDGGREIVIAGRDLSKVVILLEPVGHVLPSQPVGEPVMIRQYGAAFIPEFMVIPVGQVVEFPNDDAILHNVFSKSRAKMFNLGLYKNGATKQVTFDQPGAVHFFCSIHRNMYGVIYVAPNHLFAETSAAGQFEIVNVPVGRYDLKTWHRQLPEGVESVEVTQVDVQDRKAIDVSVTLGGMP